MKMKSEPELLRNALLRLCIGVPLLTLLNIAAVESPPYIVPLAFIIGVIYGHAQERMDFAF